MAIRIRQIKHNNNGYVKKASEYRKKHYGYLWYSTAIKDRPAVNEGCLSEEETLAQKGFLYGTKLT